MVSNWLYGPQRDARGLQDARLRSLVLDVEVLGDIARRAQHRAEAAEGSVFTSKPSTKIAYLMDGESFTREEAFALDPLDRDRLMLTIELVGDLADGHRQGVSMMVRAADATVAASPWGDAPLGKLAEQIQKETVERLNSVGRPILSRRHLLAATPCAIIPLMLGLWLWLAFTVDLVLPAHLLLAAGIGIASVACALLAHRLRVAADLAYRPSFRFRPYSRERLWRERATRRANLVVVGWTVLGSAVVALFSAYATGFFTYLFR